MKIVETTLESIQGKYFTGSYFIFRITKGLEKENPNTIAKTGSTIGLVGGSIQMLTNYNLDIGDKVDLRWVNTGNYGGWMVDTIYKD